MEAVKISENSLSHIDVTAFMAGKFAAMKAAAIAEAYVRQGNNRLPDPVTNVSER